MFVVVIVILDINLSKFGYHNFDLQILNLSWNLPVNCRNHVQLQII